MPSSGSLRQSLAGNKGWLMVELLFEDIFTLKKLDPDGKKFDKVTRIVAHSEQFDMDLQLDVNTEVYPMHVGDKFTMVLSPTLSLDGTPDTGYFTPVIYLLKSLTIFLCMHKANFSCFIEQLMENR
ncbi:hypothetical protein Taro_045700 [Colocasia esculenta]|uniref:Uncharacterized protein n=1 Tax=Colocasia esculenta TaxID=4460 RepID=A0A843X356_COLES|nr:hypothetical protein [Colocasia esculenta]